MRIFLLSGYAGSGKTTAGDLLCGLLGPSTRSTAFATAVKDQVAEMYGFSRHWCDSPRGKQNIISTADCGKKTVRQLLIEHSAAMKWEHGNPGYWADIVAEEIAKEPVADWVIHDWRYKREIQTLRVAFPDAQFITLRIQRASVIPLMDPSEHDLDEFVVDHDIQNDTTEHDLKQKLADLLENYGGGSGAV